MSSLRIFDSMSSSLMSVTSSLTLTVKLIFRLSMSSTMCCASKSLWVWQSLHTWKTCWHNKCNWNLITFMWLWSLITPTLVTRFSVHLKTLLKKWCIILSLSSSSESIAPLSLPCPELRPKWSLFCWVYEQLHMIQKTSMILTSSFKIFV